MEKIVSNMIELMKEPKKKKIILMVTAFMILRKSVE